MNRLYILPKAVWQNTLVKTGEHHEDGKVTELFIHIHGIFSQKLGSHGTDLPNGLMLLTTAFDASETQQFEQFFHGHPEVAVLPHPTTMGHVKLVDHIGDAEHKYQKHHHQALLDLPGLNLEPDDTVIDLHRKAARLNPLLRLRNVL